MLLIIEVLAAFKGNMVIVVAATFQNQHQQSVTDFGCCILYDPRASLRLLPIIYILAAFVGNMVNVVVTTPKNEWKQSINKFWSFK